MGDQRDGGIAWTDQTWNPTRGCSRVSEGCRNCYAESVALVPADQSDAYRHWWLAYTEARAELDKVRAGLDAATGEAARIIGELKAQRDDASTKLRRFCEAVARLADDETGLSVGEPTDEHLERIGRALSERRADLDAMEEERDSIRELRAEVHAERRATKAEKYNYAGAMADIAEMCRLMGEPDASAPVKAAQRWARERDAALAATADWRATMVQREVAAQMRDADATIERLEAERDEARARALDFTAATLQLRAEVARLHGGLHPDEPDTIARCADVAKAEADRHDKSVSHYRADEHNSATNSARNLAWVARRIEAAIRKLGES